MVNQTATNLLRIQSLGVKKIVVGGLQPLGCLPGSTASSSFQKCNSTFNDLVVLHNNLLSQAVTKLNQQTNNQSTFVILDLYDSFLSVLNHPSTNNIKDELKPCCVGISSQYSCGSVDENNVKKYKVCDNPKSAFFWDLLHPSQAGWQAVYNKLQTTNALQQIRYWRALHAAIARALVCCVIMMHLHSIYQFIHCVLFVFYSKICMGEMLNSFFFM